MLHFVENIECRSQDDSGICYVIVRNYLFSSHYIAVFFLGVTATLREGLKKIWNFPEKVGGSEKVHFPNVKQ